MKSISVANANWKPHLLCHSHLVILIYKSKHCQDSILTSCPLVYSGSYCMCLDVHLSCAKCTFPKISLEIGLMGSFISPCRRKCLYETTSLWHHKGFQYCWQDSDSNCSLSSSNGCFYRRQRIECVVKRCVEISFEILFFLARMLHWRSKWKTSETAELLPLITLCKATPLIARGCCVIAERERLPAATSFFPRHVSSDQTFFSPSPLPWGQNHVLGSKYESGVCSAVISNIHLSSSALPSTSRLSRALIYSSRSLMRCWLSLFSPISLLSSKVRCSWLYFTSC